MNKALDISIVIKALNEEQRIAAALESALQATEAYNAEVILADSGSTDKTIEIARQYPVRIVQLADFSQRRCGIGPQLGYQFSKGRYVYILDGDMELDPEFLPIALKQFDQNPKLGGVAGLVDEHSSESWQFRGRQARNLEGQAGKARWLDMGGLYRREALERVGYFSNQNLYACEEQELGLRLASDGWELERLGVKGIDHFGHEVPTLELMRRRWKSGYLFGSGQLMRAALGKPWLLAVMLTNKHLLATLCLLALLLVGVLMLPVSSGVLSLWLILSLLLVAQRAYRHRSLTDGLIGVFVWHVNAIAMLRGFLLPQRDPMSAVSANELS